VMGSCGGGSVAGTGYDAVLTVTCTFSTVPVNTYTVEATVHGDYYSASSEDIIVVYDQSLGFASGGGWFYWPGTNDKTNFGFTMKYNKNASNIQGNLLLIRRLQDGTSRRLKSTALFGLSMGQSADAGGDFGWATFSGKATYKEDDSLEPSGNYEFLTHLEDRQEPGRGMDRIWFVVRDKNKVPVTILSMPSPASENAVALNGGNLSVHHAGESAQ